VASVLIEKPARSDFLPVLDGGFGLQYSPLLEYREGRGQVVFCQLDVTGRTEADPAAEALARNLVNYVSGSMPTPGRGVVYVGEPAGLRHLESLGVLLRSYEAGNPPPGAALVVGPGGGKALGANGPAIAAWLSRTTEVL
jgi:hypothetical protein